VVTILCDSAQRSQAKMFDRDFLKEKGLPEPTWFVDALPDDVKEAVAKAMMPDGTMADGTVVA
jgi:hypothetical protein